MRLKKYPYNSIRERKGNLSMFYSFFSQRIQYRYWISCFLSKLPPPKKVLIFDNKNIFIRFDSVVFVFLYKYTYKAVCMFDTTRCKTTVPPTLLHSFTRFYPLFLSACRLKIARISNTLYNTRN